MDLNGKLEDVVRSFEELELRMADPGVTGNLQELQRMAKKHAEMEEVVAVYKEVKAKRQQLCEARELSESGDPEIEALAKEEVHALESDIEDLERRLQVLLLPKDPNDEKSVIVEIRGGAGGDEAALFAANLMRMYCRFAELQGWKVEILTQSETGIGGIKEVVFRVDGTGAYSKFKYESGVHRVQRVPVTESSGRIHTSTATVAVLPEVEDVDIEIRTEDLRIDTFRASGAGGQYVNMTDSAVRITHIPTGVVVSCQDERSQLKNRAKAMRLLRAKLYDAELQRKQVEQAADRKGQVGTGDRSERIRTYNFPQNRVTDHRIGLTLYKLDQILEGNLLEMIDALILADQSAKLQHINQ
ncbi:peptide chain release factor 1 [Aminiphilus circumscriptus]|uniref:peptide chain release factor 1 n=1 Tax=Aminiphilus circumscriptus TaxID=290732 RepID=UPI0004924AC4|nr:peptide chain release factor 1 [Aminiphilus circumscriptus]